MRLLGGLSPQRFLERHWQKQHLLVRAALMPPVCPLSADELFALAGNPQVESRLVIEKAPDHG